MSIDQLVAECVAQIDASHAAREQVIGASRGLIRLCANSIRATHRGDFGEAERLLGAAGAVVGQINAATANSLEIRAAGYTQDALKEYAEAHLVLAFLSGREPPGAAALGVDPAPYLNGLAEAASELRRAILDGLRRGETARGETLLQLMDDIYVALVTVDYPDAITGGLRRTTDALRAVLERTRGDISAAIRQDQLVAAMRDLERQLGQEGA
ncbi:MAG: haloacid dehalogenase [Chloroflexaceae bacterium]